MSRTPRRLFVLGGAVVLLSLPDPFGIACTPPGGASIAERAAGTTSSAIQGGVADATSTFAVEVLDSTDETCSGTLIAPNLVLTARHCVASDTGSSFVDCTSDAFNPPKDPSELRVSTEASSAKFVTAPYTGAKILVPANTKFCGNDIALIILDAKIPSAEAKPATVAIDPKNTSAYGTTITAIGYGTTMPGANDEGARRRRDGVPIQCIPGAASLDCDPSDFEMTTSELATGNGLCEGDSGSGAYIPSSIDANAPEVIGVLSRASDTGSKCTDAIYTRTDTFGAFLIAGATEAAAAGGYPAPRWAGGDGGAPEEEPDASLSEPAPDDREPDAGSGAPPAAPPPADTGCTLAPRSRSTPSLLAALLGAATLATRRRPRSRRVTRER